MQGGYCTAARAWHLGISHPSLVGQRGNHRLFCLAVGTDVVKPASPSSICDTDTSEGLQPLAEWCTRSNSRWMCTVTAEEGAPGLVGAGGIGQCTLAHANMSRVRGSLVCRVTYARKQYIHVGSVVTSQRRGLIIPGTAARGRWPPNTSSAGVMSWEDSSWEADVTLCGTARLPPSRLRWLPRVGPERPPPAGCLLGQWTRRSVAVLHGLLSIGAWSLLGMAASNLPHRSPNCRRRWMLLPCSTSPGNPHLLCLRSLHQGTNKRGKLN